MQIAVVSTAQNAFHLKMNVIFESFRQNNIKSENSKNNSAILVALYVCDALRRGIETLFTSKGSQIDSI